MVLFKRRDTRAYVLALGGGPALACLLFGLGTPLWTPAIQIPVALAVWCAVGAGVMRWRRHLPPDVDLHWIDRDEAERLAAAGPPPDRTWLFVSFERDWMRRYRLDVLVDGQLVGQLPPGTGFLLPLGPGEHRMTAYLDRPVSTVSETVNSFPGGYAGYRVRNTGTRAIKLEIHREVAARLVLPPSIRLVRPAVPEV